MKDKSPKIICELLASGECDGFFIPYNPSGKKTRLACGHCEPHTSLHNCFNSNCSKFPLLKNAISCIPLPLEWLMQEVIDK